METIETIFAICQTMNHVPIHIIRIVNVEIMFKLLISSFWAIVLATYEQMGLGVIRFVRFALSLFRCRWLTPRRYWRFHQNSMIVFITN